MSDPDDEIEALMDACGGYWGEHPRYPLGDWRFDVMRNRTRDGYWQWVRLRVEFEDVEED